MTSTCVIHQTLLLQWIPATTNSSIYLKKKKEEEENIAPFNRETLLRDSTDVNGLCVVMTSSELEELGGEGGIVV